jgi:serine/threonine-protein kinase SIK2
MGVIVHPTVEEEQKEVLKKPSQSRDFKVVKVLFQSDCKTRTVSLVSDEHDRMIVLKQVSRDMLAFSVENTETEMRVLQHINALNCNSEDEKIACSENCGVQAVCKLLDAFEDERTLNLVLEYAKHGDLFEYVAQHGALTEKVAKHLFGQLLDAIEWLHNTVQACHLDISLENLLLECNAVNVSCQLLSEENYSKVNIKLCDFGMARFFPEGKTEFPEPRFRAPGKLMYMAPEVYEQKRFDGRSADLYSAGVCLFIMLFGCPPYATPHPRRDNRYRMISEGKLADLCKAWKLKSQPSDEALDLISKIICSADRRISISDVKEHSWFRN